MFKYVLCFTFAVGDASAAMMASAQATCDGATSTGTFSVGCNNGAVSAQAVVSGPPSISLDVLVSNPVGHSGSASISYSGDFVLTVSGGTGDGFLFPCVAFDMHHYNGVVSASVHLGVWGRSSTGLSANSCDFIATSIGGQPFTFGVPQVVGFSLSGYAATFAPGFPEAHIPSFQPTYPSAVFFDTAGNRGIASYTLVSVDLPEPSAASLLGVGLMFLLVFHRDKPR